MPDNENRIRSIDIDHARDAVADARTALRQYVLGWIAAWAALLVGLAVGALGIWLAVIVHDAWVMLTILGGAPIVILACAVLYGMSLNRSQRTASSHPRQAVTLAERKLRDTQNQWDGTL